MRKKTKRNFSIAKALAPTCLTSAISICGSYVVYVLIRLVVRIFIKGYVGYLIAFCPAAIVAIVGYYYTLRKLGGLTDAEIELISPKFVKISNKLDKLLRIK